MGFSGTQGKGPLSAMSGNCLQSGIWLLSSETNFCSTCLSESLPPPPAQPMRQRPQSKVTCAVPGCPMPPYQGTPGKCCSTTCRDLMRRRLQTQPMSQRPQSEVTCALPGCQMPPYLGMPGKCCSRTCRDLMAQRPPTQPQCKRSGCTRLTWNGKPDEFCSKTCRSKGV